MKVYKAQPGIVVEFAGIHYSLPDENWDDFINRRSLHQHILGKINGAKPASRIESFEMDAILAPIGQQEIWASGVTYIRSREARMEEAKDAGAGDFYARVAQFQYLS